MHASALHRTISSKRTSRTAIVTTPNSAKAMMVLRKRPNARRPLPPKPAAPFHRSEIVYPSSQSGKWGSGTRREARAPLFRTHSRVWLNRVEPL